MPLSVSLSLCSKLPSWARAVVPKIFYVTEKAWNYYPYTITGKRTELMCWLNNLRKLFILMASTMHRSSCSHHTQLAAGTKTHTLPSNLVFCRSRPTMESGWNSLALWSHEAASHMFFFLFKTHCIYHSTLGTNTYFPEYV